MLRPEYPITTSRLLLRPLTTADAETLHSYRGDPDVCRYLPHEPLTRAEVDERLTGIWARTELDDEGQALSLGVEERASGALVGDVVLFWRSREHRRGEIGYSFVPAFAGRGYATEAAAELLRLGFAGLGLHRIIGLLDARNTASARVLERLGLRREAHLVEDEWFKGEWADTLAYAILDREWRAGPLS
jgi:RimJ/RimL family protein N-acetyltransferase